MRRMVWIVVLLTTQLVATPAAGLAACEAGWVIEPGSNVVGPAASDLMGVGGVAEDDVWAVGSYERDDGAQAPLTQHWDGAEWTRVPFPGDLVGLLQAVDVLATGNAWAVGSIVTPSQASKAIAFHWDGDRWNRQVVPKPEPGRFVSTVFTDVAVLGMDDVWAVGRWSPVPDAPAATLVEHWDGESWEVVQTPALENWHDFNSISAVAPDDIWAVGSQTFTAERYITERALIEHWNGTRWNVVRSPIVATRLPFLLESVDARTASDVWAVGNLSRASRTVSISFHWDGYRWTEVPIVDPSDELQLLASVATVGRDHAIAVGSYFDANRRERTLVVRWDGERWTQAKSESRPAGNILRDVIALPPRHFAVGSYWANDGDGPQRPLVLRRCAA